MVVMDARGQRIGLVDRGLSDTYIYKVRHTPYASYQIHMQSKTHAFTRAIRYIYKVRHMELYGCMLVYRTGYNIHITQSQRCTASTVEGHRGIKSLVWRG